MIVFGKIVAAKMTVFKTPTGTSVAVDADDLTWNYYRSWNLMLSAGELKELKTTGEVTKSSGKTYEKNWASTVRAFTESLNFWNTQSTG